jgi:alpha-L-fucosidase
VKSLDHLLDIYYKSVGRNSLLLLNVPPNDKGLIPDPDVARLREWRRVLDEAFAMDFARSGRASASNVRGRDSAFGAAKATDGDAASYWATDDGVTEASLELDLGAAVTFNVTRIEEAISLGQRVEAYRIEGFSDGAWKAIAKGTTIGRKKLDRVQPVTASKVRLVIEKARACPAIRAFGIHIASMTGG